MIIVDDSHIEIKETGLKCVIKQSPYNRILHSMHTFMPIQNQCAISHVCIRLLWSFIHTYQIQFKIGEDRPGELVVDLDWVTPFLNSIPAYEQSRLHRLITNSVSLTIHQLLDKDGFNMYVGRPLNFYILDEISNHLMSLNEIRMRDRLPTIADMMAHYLG